MKTNKLSREAYGTPACYQVVRGPGLKYAKIRVRVDVAFHYFFGLGCG